MAKKGLCLPKGKISRQKSKMLMRTGGELEDMMQGSYTEKMRKGGDAERITTNSKGESKKQKYKLGGWTHSGK